MVSSWKFLCLYKHILEIGVFFSSFFWGVVVF